jgi:hypothetical protein
MAAPVLPRNSLPTTAPITTPISEGMVVSDLPQNPGKRECQRHERWAYLHGRLLSTARPDRHGGRLSLGVGGAAGQDERCGNDNLTQ